jgi:hypothetical protein
MKFRLLRLCLPNIVSNGYCKYTKFKLLRLHFTNILNNFFLQIPNAHLKNILLLQIHHAVSSLLSYQVQVERLHLHHPHPAHRSPLRRAQVRSSNFFIFIEMIVSFIHLNSFYWYDRYLFDISKGWVTKKWSFLTLWFRSLSWVINSGYVFEGSFAKSVAQKLIFETCKF